MSFAYANDDASFTAAYLWPRLRQIMACHAPPPRRVFELGCGNGATARFLGDLGYEVTGVDPSGSGIHIAREHARAGMRFEVNSSDDDLAGRFGRFPVVVSLEVVEHCVSARRFAASVRSLLSPGGVAIVSTPYHGWLKTIAVVAAGRFDHHFDPLWEGGHLHFFSVAKLREMFRGAGLDPIEVHRVGRVPILAKSVIAVAKG